MKNLVIIAIFAALLSFGGLKVYEKIRGIRNNNPGNIRRSNDAWKGLSPVQDDPLFFKFESPEYGIRAMMKLLLNYEKNYGIKTVKGLISRWAPGNENPTGNYVDFVSNVLSVAPDKVIDVRSNLLPLSMAIVRFENGLDPYSTSVYKRAEAMV